MRGYFESLEESILAPYAVKSKNSRGKQYKEDLSLYRTEFQRDRDRIIHSKAFRRLKHKTQVFVATESDHYRTRLTHTLEVAQISRHISRILKLNEDLSEAIALAHDLGHTPFGHAGEEELNQLMIDYGGFEHNAHSLRIVDVLENKSPNFPGLNLSFEVRVGLMKHETPWDKPQSQETFRSLEAEVVNLADQIAYNNHDIDDGLSSFIISEPELCKNVELWATAKKSVMARYTNVTVEQVKYLVISELISMQVQNVIQTTQKNIKLHHISSLEDLELCSDNLVAFDKEMEEQSVALKNYLFNTFYHCHNVYRMNMRGRIIIKKLFQLFIKNPKLIPSDYHQTNDGIERRSCDYIAGMTDTFAEQEYATIFA